KYCVVDSSDCPDFIHWFFGDWQVRGIEKGDRVDGAEIGKHLEVRLFFGEWSEVEIVIARSTMGKYPRSKRSNIWGMTSGIWEPGEGRARS
ncbi:hypothetical protein BT69DRAFT_1277713, partial [Atractiella rhizophila]